MANGVRSIIVLTIFYLTTWNLDEDRSLHSFDGVYQHPEVLKWNVSTPVDKVSIYEQPNKIGCSLVFIQTCNLGVKLSLAVNDGTKDRFETFPHKLQLAKMAQFDGILSRGKCQKLGLKVKDKWTHGQIWGCWKPRLIHVVLVTNVPDPKRRYVFHHILHSFRIMNMD